MRGKQKGIFLVSQSNGSAVQGQLPSLRVRLASSGVTIALIKLKRHNLTQWCGNNPQSAERKELDRQMFEQGYTREDVVTILSKEVS